MCKGDGTACSSAAVVAKALYAIAAICRNNEMAQEALLLADGLAAIAEVAGRSSGSDVGTQTDVCKIRSKSIAFMYDLLTPDGQQRRNATSMDALAAGLGTSKW